MGVLSKRKKNRGNSEIPMASTSDVAFLLLVFFIVMPMKTEEIGISLVLPGKTNKQDTAKVSQKNVATIKVTQSGRIMFDGQPIQLKSIQQMIRDRIQANDKTIVILETHPDAVYGVMVACLDEVKLSGARKFSLKTTEL